MNPFLRLFSPILTLRFQDYRELKCANFSFGTINEIQIGIVVFQTTEPIFEIIFSLTPILEFHGEGSINFIFNILCIIMEGGGVLQVIEYMFGFFLPLAFTFEHYRGLKCDHPNIDEINRKNCRLHFPKQLRAHNFSLMQYACFISLEYSMEFYQ